MTTPELAVGETIRRRALLATRPNPRQNMDYVVRLETRLSSPAARVEICYVPDRLLLEPESLSTYTAALEKADRRPLEELAATLLEDVSDELVPRWVRVIVALDPPADGVRVHAAMLQDRQPNWSNDELLAGLHVV